MSMSALRCFTEIAPAVDWLAGGGILCVPTETTYGLAVDLQNRPALDALFRLKGRPANAPFALIAGDLPQARALAAPWPEAAETLARRYWPGPLTLVVPAAPDLPGEVVGDVAGFGRGVGVRVSSHPVAVALAAGLGRPITATSANPSGAPAAVTPAEAQGYFGSAIAYFDAGPAPAERASTVAAVSAQGRIAVLRQGPIVLGHEPAPSGAGGV